MGQCGKIVASVILGMEIGGSVFQNLFKFLLLCQGFLRYWVAICVLFFFSLLCLLGCFLFLIRGVLGCRLFGMFDAVH